MTDASTPGSLIGGDILGLITIGMYDNPLAIYREYIQNAADAISSAGDTRNGRVEIDIDPSLLRVRIRDNGPGLSHEAAVRALLPIARSQKRRETDRGFRGIGRLSGLAFAESVVFLTRTEGTQPVTRIVWDGPKLHSSINKGGQTGSAIQECVSVETLPNPKYPAHFFEVNICGVGRHAAGLILNREAVRTYISEVCPVPMAPKFPFVSEVEDRFGENESPLALEIILDGESTPVMRRYGENDPVFKGPGRLLYGIRKNRHSLRRWEQKRRYRLGRPFLLPRRDTERDRNPRHPSTYGEHPDWR